MQKKTNEILTYFQQINDIPRCSKQEDRIALWLRDWAEEHGFSVKADATGNLAVTVPATPGYENAPIVILQGHMDMVCEKTPESEHDFAADSIPLVFDGDWVRAEGTSLGADNGIAIALAMAAATDESVVHPPLELLLTVDEETGLNGAKDMEPGLIEGRILLNIDSEDEGVFTVGCAGGNDTKIELDLTRVALNDGYAHFRLSVGELKGGHSGIDIHKRRANANKLLARCLDLLGESADFQLVDLKGGTKHNAIPRNSEAVIACNPTDVDDLKTRVGKFNQTVRHEYATEDPGIVVSLESVADGLAAPDPLAPEDGRKIIRLILALPHGMMGLSAEFDGLVETSTNLAPMGIEADRFKVLTSQRSSLISKQDEITTTVKSVALLAEADVVVDKWFAPWQPDLDAPLLERCQGIYRQLFDRNPVVEAIHAGLECAVIGDKYDHIEMISFGPTIENPHSPHERLNIPSIEPIWEFMTELLASYAKNSSE
jgi:dipeptidase D